MSGVRYVSVNVDVDPDDVLGELNDRDLSDMGLMRVKSEEVAVHHEALFAAAERGDCHAAFAAAEQLAWTMYGRILTGKVAA